MRARHDEIQIDADGVTLLGTLHGPRTRESGIVLFAHGSGSSRMSPRNRMVAAELNEAGLGTLLLDLLTAEVLGVGSPNTWGYKYD
jgi:putative phosphoribosyl transferase